MFFTLKMCSLDCVSGVYVNAGSFEILKGKRELDGKDKGLSGGWCGVWL
jgi:hypothetical protein